MWNPNPNLSTEEILAKIKSGVTELDLTMKKSNHNNPFHFHVHKSQAMKSELKEQEPFVRHSKQTLHYGT